MKATEVTAGLAESNGSLLPGLWRDSLHVTCGLTACTPGSAPGPTLGNEYGKTLPLPLLWHVQTCRGGYSQPHSLWGSDAAIGYQYRSNMLSVSYTHLTLPTIYSV